MNYSILGWAGFLVFLSIMLVSTYFIFFNNPQFSPEDKDNHVECINNTCVLVKGSGVNECSSPGAFCGCLDTDISSEFPDGINSQTRGTTRNEESSKTDYCSEFGETLFEHSCEDGKIIQTPIECASTPGFVCQNGRCLSQEEAHNECIDSDGGSDYFTVGAASQAHRTIQDSCADSKTLREMICNEEENIILVEIVNCEELGNYKCQGGACIS